MAGISASGRLDEIEIRRVRPGHAVRIAGPAFPGFVLEGKIVSISSRASRPSGQQRLPTFEVAAAVDRLSEAQRKAVRLGMSADMEIVVYENDKALVLPIHAVDNSKRKPRVRVRDDETGTIRTVEVKTGTTTRDSVEILGGLARGDRVVVP